MNLQLLKEYLATLEVILGLTSNDCIYKDFDDKTPSVQLFNISDKMEELKNLIDIEEEKIVKERFNFLVNQMESVKSEMRTMFNELAIKKRQKVCDLIRGEVKITKDWGEIRSVDLSQNDATFEVINNGGERVFFSLDDLCEDDLITLIDFMFK